MGDHDQPGWVNQAQRFYLEKIDEVKHTCCYLLAQFNVPNPSDTAGDLAQRVYELCGRVRDEDWAEVANKDGYLYTIIENAAKEMATKHRNRREETYEPDEIDKARVGGPVLNPDSALHAAIQLAEIMRLLSPEEVRLLDLSFQGYTTQEIASTLGLSNVAARQRLTRLKKKLILLTETGGSSPPTSASPPSDQVRH